MFLADKCRFKVKEIYKSVKNIKFITNKTLIFSLHHIRLDNTYSLPL